MIKNKQFYVQNEGDDDTNLWVVVDETNQVFFSSRSKYEAEKWIAKNSKSNEITPTTPDYENCFISELAREIGVDMAEI